MAAPTWTSLRPILRGEAVREDRTWQVVEHHHDFVLGVVRRTVSRSGRDVVARYPDRDAAAFEAFQWAVERLVRRIGNPPPGLPVSEREDGELGSAVRWFDTVCANLTRDWLKSRRRQITRETSIPEHKPPSVAPADPWDGAALRKLERLVARPDRAGVPATHVLAYLAFYRPEVLDEGTVRLAAEYVPQAGSRSGTPGLARPVEVTWAALSGWRERHGASPRSTAARAELAWILRSDDPGPPETWRDRCGADARRGATTVGKWAIRCADVLTLPRGGRP